MLTRWAEAAPLKPAFIDGERLLTWSELDDQVSRLAAGMGDLGVSKGDPVAVLSRDRLEIVVHWLACMRLGAVRVGVNPRYSAREMRHVIRDCGAPVILVDTALAHLLPTPEDGDHNPPKLIQITGSQQAERTYTSLLVKATRAWPTLLDDDLALISYTSGTTGLPKGVLISHGAIGAALVNTTIMMGLAPDDVWYQAGSLAWAAALMAFLGLTNGMTTVLPGDGETYTPESLIQAIKHRGVTAVALVPVMIRGLLQRLENDDVDLSDLRLLGYGSSPAPPALVRRVREILPSAKLVQIYGATECSGGWVTVLSNADHVRALSDHPHLLESCGRATLWSDVRVADDEGNQAPRGEHGEVWVRSPTACQGYHQLPEQTANLFVGDWIRTNDIGWMDEEGYLYLTDRKDFMIITGAINVFPSVVENVIREHPAVQDVAVVGVRHPRWGEAIVAVVELCPGAQARPEDLLAVCRGKLAAFEVPKHIEFVAELPRNATGKIARTEILNRVTEHPERLPWNMDDLG
jgi:acyl-CoA synthetase (AMP-forming)/AMP-acid ligase II